MKKVLDVGERVGKIIRMHMGVKVTNILIREEEESKGWIEHSIIVTNEVAQLLKMGESVSLKLEIFP